jgi:hypothetical protein
MNDVSTFRLYLLRASYLFVVVGLGFMIWPGILDHTPSWTLMRTVVHAMLGAVSILCVIGVFHPLRMIPVLLFELTWKALWLVAFALPLWRADRLDPQTMTSVGECVFGVVVVSLVLPWGHVWRRYLRGPGARPDATARAAASSIV